MHVFKLLEETPPGVPREPHKDTGGVCKLLTESTGLPYPVINPEISCCETTVLSTKPPGHFISGYIKRTTAKGNC